MTIYLKDEATSKAVRKLAELRGTTLTEAVRFAVAGALENESIPKRRKNAERALKEPQAEVAKHAKTGLKADRAFFDELSGDI